MNRVLQIVLLRVVSAHRCAVSLPVVGGVFVVACSIGRHFGQQILGRIRVDHDPKSPLHVFKH